ncbi:MAG: hypothetical protein ACREJU_19640, partial [Nitrospiraceae bacterium]
MAATAPSSTRSTEQRTLHFDLSHLPAGVEHTLFLGGVRHTLIGHDDASRARHRRTAPIFRHIPDERLTHHVSLNVPADALQTFYVIHGRKSSGLPHLSTFGLHVPKGAVRRHHDRHGFAKGLHTAKIRRLGLQERRTPPADADSATITTVLPPDLAVDDLADFHDPTEAAKFAVFHHPEILSLEVDTALLMLGKIESTRSFDDLANTISQEGMPAQHPDSDYEGWANGKYVLDVHGQKIENPKKPGTYYWSWEYMPAVNTALRPVVQQALRLVRDDKAMDGISFMTTYGIHAVDGNASMRAVSATPQTMAARVPASADTDIFSLDDPGWSRGYKVTIETQQGRHISFKTHNSSFLYRGVFVRFLGPDKQKIPLADLPVGDLPPQTPNDTSYDRLLGSLPNRPRFLGIPLGEESSDLFTLTLPDQAFSIEVLVGSAGSDGYDAPNYAGVEAPGSVQTFVLGFCMPGFFLAFGVSVAQIQGVLAPLLGALANYLLQFAAFPTTKEILSQGGRDPDSTLDKPMIKQLMFAVIQALPPMFVKTWAAITAAVPEEDAENAIPIVGTVIEVAGVVATLTEMLETVATLSETNKVEKRTVCTNIPVTVTIHPDPNDDEFPAGARHYKITAYQTASLFTIFEGDLPSLNVSTVERTFTVASGGQIKIEVQFTDPESGWIGGRGESDWISNVLPPGQDTLGIEFTITENVVPLNEQTPYQHVQKLSIRGRTHVW